MNLVAPARLVHRARDRANWDRKGWPGSKIKCTTTPGELDINVFNFKNGLFSIEISLQKVTFLLKEKYSDYLNVEHYFPQIKVSRVSLWIEHSHNIFNFWIEKYHPVFRITLYFESPCISFKNLKMFSDRY